MHEYGQNGVLACWSCGVMEKTDFGYGIADIAEVRINVNWFFGPF